MELSKPAIVTPSEKLMTARSVDDPFFANANHQLSDKGFMPRYDAERFGFAPRV